MDNKIFGLSERALQLCEDRGVMLTNNLVNSSTPNYKARDMDFQKELLKAQTNANAGSLRTTLPQHISSGQQSDATSLYRIPMQKSLDGNTVDDEIERKNFIANALRYQTNLTFVRNKTTELLKAIKGE